MKTQFFTTVSTILMVGVTTIGVNLAVIGAMAEANDLRFSQIDARFEQVDRRFEQVDRRFEQVEQRLDQMDRRFEQIDRRFEQVDRRFEIMDQRMDKGFKETAAAIARLEGLIQGLHGTARSTAGQPASDPEQSS